MNEEIYLKERQRRFLKGTATEEDTLWSTSLPHEKGGGEGRFMLEVLQNNKTRVSYKSKHYGIMTRLKKRREDITLKDLRELKLKFDKAVEKEREGDEFR